MKSNLFYLIGLACILLISCNKSDNDNPPVNTRDWFKLKTKLRVSTRNGSPYSSDSTSIEIDSVNNKIIFKSYGVTGGDKDSSIETYTYNNNNQLVLYEHVDNYYELYISRMQFVRDASGQVTKVLSEYKNGLIASSEGTCTYQKRGDTTFITYLDSAKKHKQSYYDGQDFYQVGLLNNKIVYSKQFAIKSAYQTETAGTKFEYDAAGNLISETLQSGATPLVYTYQYGSGELKDVQEFMTQWTGDLFWFSRSKLFHFWAFLGYNSMVGLNELKSIKRDNVAYMTFTNGFDVNGNLSSITYQTKTGASTFTSTEQYKYRP